MENSLPLHLTTCLGCLLEDGHGFSLHQPTKLVMLSVFPLQFFNNMLMLGKQADSEVSSHIYELIYELNQVAPSILLAVIPQLEFKLKVFCKCVSSYNNLFIHIFNHNLNNYFEMKEVWSVVEHYFKLPAGKKYRNVADFLLVLLLTKVALIILSNYLMIDYLNIFYKPSIQWIII